MLYVVDENKKVVASCKTKPEIEQTVINYMEFLIKGKSIVPIKVVEAKTWEACECGFYYVKTDNNFIMRYYEKINGYIYNSYTYEELCDVSVCEFIGKPI
jgi:hypothetical protein